MRLIRLFACAILVVAGTIVEFSPADGSAMNVTLHYVESTEQGSRRR